MNDVKESILFLCTGNSCRSQMAEGICRRLYGEQLDVYSAGIEKHGLNPWALEVMKEIDIDISGHQSQTLEDLDRSDFTYVITVCGHAHENCPLFPGKAKVIHIGFEDPPFLAKGLTNREEILPIYRRVRDEIKTKLENLETYLNS